MREIVKAFFPALAQNGLPQPGLVSAEEIAFISATKFMAHMAF